MTFIRPEVIAQIHRWREVIASAALVGAALWIGTRGGPLLAAIGLLLGAGALGLGRLAWQRLRFARTPDGPGIVEIDEGQIGWYGPGIGGYVALDDLSLVGLITVAKLRVWRLAQTDGQVLLIPTHAQGADALFDALSSLPGMTPGALLAALDSTADTPAIWRRRRPLALT